VDRGDRACRGSAAAVSSGNRACRWIASGGLAQLGPGTLNADHGIKTVAISDGGNLIAGYRTNMLASLLPFMWTQGVGFGNLYDYLLYRGFTPSQLGHFSDSFLPWDLSGNGRIIVGRTGAFSGLPGWVAITRNFGDAAPPEPAWMPERKDLASSRRALTL
jgi:hypothetical protein